MYLRINKFIENISQSHLKYEMCLFKNNLLIKFQTEKFHVFMDLKSIKNNTFSPIYIFIFKLENE